MAALQAVDQPAALKRLLEENNLDADVIQYMLEHMNFSSIRVFARAFNCTNHQSLTTEMILDNVPSCKGNIVQGSRLRVAWEQARAELDGALKRKDLGLPTDDFSVENLHKDFMQAYSFRMDASMLPEPILLSQIATQMECRCVSVHDLSMVQAPSIHEGHLAHKRRRTFEGLSDLVQIDIEARPRAVNTPARVIAALSTLLNGYALCGLLPVQTSDKRGQTRTAHYGDLQHYLNFVIERAALHRGRSTVAAKWLVEADRSSRKIARDALEAHATPFGETLRCIAIEPEIADAIWCLPEARKQPRRRAQGSGRERPSRPARASVPTPLSSTTELQGDLQGGESSDSPSQQRAPHGGDQLPRSPSRPPRGRQPDRQRELPHQARQHPDVEEQFAYEQLCTKFNEPIGCSHKQRDCPHKLKHRCNHNLADGSICGQWQHNFIHCPWNPDAPTSKYKKNWEGGKRYSYEHSY